MTLSSAPAFAVAPARRAAPWRSWLVLTGALALALGLLATVALLAVQMHFEARDRALLHQHLERVQQMLGGVDNASALTQLPERLAATLEGERDLALRIQGPLGQPLYEQSAAGMPAALFVHPAPSFPLPLTVWWDGVHAWRGGALVLRMPLDGSAPLVVGVALEVGRDEAFLRTLRWVLIGDVVLTLLGFMALSWWLLRRLTR